MGFDFSKGIQHFLMLEFQNIQPKRKLLAFYSTQEGYKKNKIQSWGFDKDCWHVTPLMAPSKPATTHGLVVLINCIQ